MHSSQEQTEIYHLSGWVKQWHYQEHSHKDSQTMAHSGCALNGVQHKTSTGIIPPFPQTYILIRYNHEQACTMEHYPHVTSTSMGTTSHFPTHPRWVRMNRNGWVHIPQQFIITRTEQNNSQFQHPIISTSRGMGLMSAM